MLGFISIFLLRNGLFNWLAHSITVFNTYRLRKEIISINHEWFRNEGHEFNNVAEEFVKNIDSRNTQELKVSPAFEELVLHKRDTVASIALLEVAYSGLQKII